MSGPRLDLMERAHAALMADFLKAKVEPSLELVFATVALCAGGSLAGGVSQQVFLSSMRMVYKEAAAKAPPAPSGTRFMQASPRRCDELLERIYNVLQREGMEPTPETLAAMISIVVRTAVAMRLSEDTILAIANNAYECAEQGCRPWPRPDVPTKTTAHNVH